MNMKRDDEIEVKVWSGADNPQLQELCKDIIRLVSRYVRRSGSGSTSQSGDWSGMVSPVAVAEAITALYLAIETIEENTGVVVESNVE